MKKLYLIEMSEENKWKPIVVKDDVIIGRHDKCDIILKDDSISSKHAKISVESGKFILEDSESTNGTRIHGERISAQTLRDGDLLSIGMVNFLVRIADFIPRLYFPKEDKTVAIAMFPFHIGRTGGGNHLIINNNSVSSKHASIDEQFPGKYTVKDYKSTNGTRVNGKRIEFTDIQDGDVVKFGKRQAVFLEKEMNREGYRLTFLSEDRVGEEVPLADRVAIGRVRDNDLVIPHSSVSGKHSLIYWARGRYWIKDLGSRNGTRVGGVKIKEVPLKHGDEVSIAKHALLFHNTELPKEKFSLVYLGGKQGGKEVEISQSTLVIGRDKSCDITIQGKTISSKHAQVEVENGIFSIKDLGSTNGTIVNNTKTQNAPLSHGDEIIIGTQHFIFRDSSKIRPEALQEEQFVLLPVDGKNQYGDPIKIENICSIGSSQDNTIVLSKKIASPKHAIITKEANGYSICDCGSQYGTYVNNEFCTDTVYLDHGDELLIGRRRYIFKSSLRPLKESLDVPIPHIFTASAVAIFLFLMISLFFVSSMGTSEEKKKPIKKKTPVKVVKRKEDKDWARECFAKTKKYQEQFQYEEAIAVVQKYYKKLTYLQYKDKFTNKIAKLEQQYKHFQNLVYSLQKSKNVYANIPGRGRCKIKFTGLKRLTFVTPKGDSIDIPWKDISDPILFSMIDQSKFAKNFPYQAVQMALHRKFEDKLKEYLVLAFVKHPEKKEEIENLYAKIANTEIPKGGFVVYLGKFIPAEKLEEIKKQEKIKREALRKEQEKLVREQLEKYAREKEKTNFTSKMAIIEDYVKTYDYRSALKQFYGYEKELYSSKLKKKVRKRIKEVKRLRYLFSKLIKSIKKGTLQNDIVQMGDMKGRIVKANSERFRIVIKRGKIEQRWYEITPKKLVSFYNRMRLSSRDLYILGVFSFENNLLYEGNKAFIKLIKRSPKKKRYVDKYLSRMLRIPIPKGGFVAHGGMLVSKNERKYRLKGLVKYRGDWVTPEDKEKYEAGFVKSNGKWITRSEKKLLARGYIKFKNKWYTQSELKKLRSNWEHAWTCDTRHYHIKTNLDENFMKELALFIEAAHSEYEKFFGRELDKSVIRLRARRTGTEKLRLFVFKNYEGYRNYCLKNNNAAQLKAGGFASSGTNAAAFWFRSGKMDLFRTTIHEGAHLFHYNAYKRLRIPSWFAEGVATQFEGFEWDGRNLKINYISENRLIWLKRAFVNRKTLSLEELVTGNALKKINASPNQAATFYSQCWGLYYYLRNIAKKSRKDRFHDFVKRMNNAEYEHNQEQAFLDVFAKDVDAIENDYRRYIISLK